MGCCSESAKNRLAFMVMGAANSMVYTTMLAAAFDLLSRSQEAEDNVQENIKLNGTSLTQQPKPFCNKQSTSTILLANTLPSLIIKIFYPFLLVSVHSSYKTIAVSILSASAFLITGLFMSQLVVFIGVICASLAFGMGESSLLSISYQYGDSSMSGWYSGTGLAAFCGSLSYALLRMFLPVKYIMMVLLIAPLSLLVAYFSLKLPQTPKTSTNTSSGNHLSIIGAGERKLSDLELAKASAFEDESPETSSFKTKLLYLSGLSRYFFPLLLVYFAEYFINQGLFELIYYPEVSRLDHAAQYRWFVVSYQLGVVISRSSLDVIKINNIWAMSLLQFANAVLFFAHAAKLIHLPSFYLVLALIVYEGLLGGFTYVNAFYRIKQEAPPLWREFSISAATIADALGIVTAGFAALPAHNALCKLYV